MTVRWSGVPSDEGGDAPSGRISKQNAGGFSHSARREVFRERVFATGARERTSVVEADSKHSGGASKVKPQGPTRSTSPSDRKAKGPDEGPSHSLRARVHRSRKPQGGSEPSMMVPYDQLEP